MWLNNNTWYDSVTLNGKRKVFSLKTKNKRIASQRAKKMRDYYIMQMANPKKEHKANRSIQTIIDDFLSANHNWSDKTRSHYNTVLKQYGNGVPFPTNKSSRANWIRHINVCLKWGFENGYLDKIKKIEGDQQGQPRLRVLNDKEMQLVLNDIQDDLFKSFVRFAYYTGARRGELLNIKSINIENHTMSVVGKTGERLVKLNNQAIAILLELDHTKWNYLPTYVTKKFKKEIRKLGIRDAQFHDLRRTFGYNLIKRGMQIYQVSKLLGHSSVATTQRHYAPLLVTDVEDFTLP